MKVKNIISFIVIMVLIAAFACVCAFDIHIGNFTVPSVMDSEKGIKRGLDLVGGSIIVFEPDVENLSDVTADQMDSAEQVLRARLDSQNLTEATISNQGDHGLRVEIPNIDNPEEAISLIGQVAKLEFLDADGNVLMDGSDTYVKKAESVYGPLSQDSNSEYYVKLTLTAEGRKAFKTATEKAMSLESESKNYITIALDGVPQVSPWVHEVIDSEDCQITGNYEAKDAQELADLINSGSLPFALTASEQRSVGATLGREALDSALKAALVGIILIMLFMLLFYRLPGLVADISLVAYISITLLIMAGFFIGDGISTGYRVTLTLPGIAGVILSIGMAVDANVVIFERIKDELRQGKSVGAAVDSGFKRAITAVIDSNVTTIIACGVLYFVGSGTVKNFALTLFIGIVCSMITAIFLTKLLLKLIVGFGVKSPVLYGVNKRRDA